MQIQNPGTVKGHHRGNSLGDTGNMVDMLYALFHNGRFKSLRLMTIFPSTQMSANHFGYMCAFDALHFAIVSQAMFYYPRCPPHFIHKLV